jgi:hypothetical protein
VVGEYYFDEFAADDAVRVPCEVTPPPPPPPPGGDEDARTIGYWKTKPHQDHVEELLTLGPVDLGDTTVTTYANSQAIFKAAKGKDMRNMLRAQLLATILNLRNGSDPNALGYDIGTVVADAIEFLDTHDDPVYAGHPDRDEAEALKDALDAYNNSGED